MSQTKTTKKTPQRMCLGCRCMKPKNELLRLVKLDDGTVIFDETKKMPGRGAYVCTNPDCFEHIMKTKALARALKTTIPGNVRESLYNAYKILSASTALAN